MVIQGVAAPSGCYLGVFWVWVGGVLLVSRDGVVALSGPRNQAPLGRGLSGLLAGARAKHSERATSVRRVSPMVMPSVCAARMGLLTEVARERDAIPGAVIRPGKAGVVWWVPSLSKSKGPNEGFAFVFIGVFLGMSNVRHYPRAYWGSQVIATKCGFFWLGA
jgi:hypothetical protein